MGNIPDKMFTVGQHAWHRSGYTYPLDTPPATVEEALQLAGLDWEVDLVPLVPSDGRQLESNREDGQIAMAAVRSDTQHLLGVVGPDYAPLQNDEAFATLEPLTESGLLSWETAGVLENGRMVWVLAKYADGTYEPVRNDVVDTYLLIVNGHGGKCMLRAANTPIRAVCENTISTGLQAARNLIRIRHYGDVRGQLDLATARLARMHTELVHIQEVHTELAHTTMTTTQRHDYWRRCIPMPPDRTAHERVQQGWDMLEQLHETGRGMNIPGVRGTAWGALQAAIEYADYYMGTTDTRIKDRSAYVLTGAPSQLRRRALTSILDYAPTLPAAAKQYLN